MTFRDELTRLAQRPGGMRLIARLYPPDDDEDKIETPPSDMKVILDHAAAALDCVGMVCRKQAERGTLRGLGRTRGVRALLAAAARVEGLSWYLSDLAREDHEITLEEHAPILAYEFAKIRRARKTIRQAADLDWLRTDYKNRDCPTFHQLAEVDQVDVNRAAFFSVAVMADAIRFALLGAYDMQDARIRAAEELAEIRGMMLEQPA